MIAVLLFFAVMTAGITLFQMLNKKTIRPFDPYEQDPIGRDGESFSDDASSVGAPHHVPVTPRNQRAAVIPTQGGPRALTQDAPTEPEGEQEDYNGPQLTENICETQGCRSYGAFLMSFVKTSLDPCEDFHGFVSGKAGPDFDYKEYATSVALSDVVGDLTKRRVPREKQSAIDKAALLLQGCVASKTFEDVQEALKVLGKSGLRFQPNDGDDPFAAMVALAARFGNGILFSMDVAPVSSANVTRPAIIIRPNQMFVNWASNSSARSDGELLTKLTEAYQLTSSGGINSDLALGIYNTSDTVYQTWRANKNGPSAGWSGKLEDFDRMSSHFSSKIILSHVNRRLTARFTEDDEVSVLDLSLISFVDRVISENDRKRVVVYLAYEFLRQMDPYIREDAVPKSAEKSTSYCFPMLQPYVGTVAYASLLRRRLRRGDYARISDLYENIKKSAATHTDDGKWFPHLADRDTKITSDFLDRISLQIGFPNELRDEAAFEKLYDHIPDMTGFFFEDLLTWQAGQYGVLAQPSAGNLDQFKSLEPTTRYDQKENKIVLYSTTPLPEHFYGNGADAGNYGVLGSAMAAGMGSALASAWNRLWTDSKTALWYDEKLSCLRNLFGETLAGIQENIPSLLFTRSLRSALVDGTAKKQRVVGLEGYSAEQLFFVSTCVKYFGKGQPRENNVWPNALRCNNPLKNSPAFAKAFGCSKGSPMNPARKCLLW